VEIDALLIGFSISFSNLLGSSKIRRPMSAEHYSSEEQVGSSRNQAGLRKLFLDGDEKSIHFTSIQEESFHQDSDPPVATRSPV